MAAALHLLVRLVHIIGMAMLLGIAGIAWTALRERDCPLSLLRRAEWLFWGTMGVMAVTGVGNLGTLGPPGPTTRWGTILTIKLTFVLAFVLGSAVRTLAVTQINERVLAQDATRLRHAYATTGWILLAIVTLAEVLAHG